LSVYLLIIGFRITEKETMPVVYLPAEMSLDRPVLLTIYEGGNVGNVGDRQGETKASIISSLCLKNKARYAALHHLELVSIQLIS